MQLFSDVLPTADVEYEVENPIADYDYITADQYVDPVMHHVVVLAQLHNSRKERRRYKFVTHINHVMLICHVVQ